MAKNKLENSVKILTAAIREDKDLHYSYQSNIALAFHDEFKKQCGIIGRHATIDNLHVVSNIAAKNFLDLWCQRKGGEK
jgi:hypothetical protein